MNAVLRRILVCLVLGAVTTVLVAWLLALRLVVTVPGGSPAAAEGVFAETGENARLWWCRRLERPGLTVVAWQHLSTGILSRRLRLDQAPIEAADLPAWARRPPPGATRDLSDFTASSARGFPARALWYEARFRLGARTNDGGLEIPPLLHRLGPGRVLPLRPVPAGFALDTAVYAGIWAALLWAPGALRRAQRRRQGQCPACGYDLRGGGERCPECGAAAVRKKENERWPAPSPSR